MRLAALSSALSQVASGATSPSQAVADGPASPTRRISALTSLSLHLERSTNIDKRFIVGARMSALQASKISSGEVFQPTKLASRRPLAEQYPASRACDKPSGEKLLVNWLCRNEAASAPRAAITPQCVKTTEPSRVCSLVMCRLSSAPMKRLRTGLTRHCASLCRL